MYIYICIYIYMYIDMFTCIYMCTYTCVCMYIYIYIHIYMNVYMCTCVLCICIYAYFSSIYRYMYVCIYSRECVSYKHFFLDTYIHTYRWHFKNRSTDITTSLLIFKFLYIGKYALYRYVTKLIHVRSVILIFQQRPDLAPIGTWRHMYFFAYFNPYTNVLK